MSMTAEQKEALLVEFTKEAMKALILAHSPTDSVAVKAARIAYQTLKEIELTQEYKKS